MWTMSTNERAKAAQREYARLMAQGDNVAAADVAVRAFLWMSEAIAEQDTRRPVVVHRQDGMAFVEYN